MARVRLFCGPHGSGRGQAIDNLLLSRWGLALLIVPTHRRDGALHSNTQPNKG